MPPDLGRKLSLSLSRAFISRSAFRSRPRAREQRAIARGPRSRIQFAAAAGGAQIREKSKLPEPKSKCARRDAVCMQAPQKTRRRAPFEWGASLESARVYKNCPRGTCWLWRVAERRESQEGLDWVIGGGCACVLEPRDLSVRDGLVGRERVVRGCWVHWLPCGEIFDFFLWEVWCSRGRLRIVGLNG